MARNMCYAAQQVLADRDRAGRPIISPVAQTAKQERESVGGTTYWAKSGKDLWKLKNQQPHLFQRRPADGQGTNKWHYPAGFEESSTPGWLFNPERQVFLSADLQRRLWLDGEAKVYRELHEGEDLSDTLAVRGAATRAGKGSDARHVVIMDLHKAAEAFKLDLSHLDKPAAMLAVYSQVAGGVPSEVAARSLHERVLKRLSAHRSVWSDESLQAVLIDAFAHVAADHSSRSGSGDKDSSNSGKRQETGPGVAATVVLLLGPKLVAATTQHGVCCLLEDPDKQDSKPSEEKSAATGESPVQVATLSAGGATTHTSCAEFCQSATGTGQCILLATGPASEQAYSAAAAHVAKGRPRAGAIALLQGARQGGATSRAAACARLSWAPEGPAAKRQRVAAEGSSAEVTKVRCRQILLKYIGCRQARDPVRRGRVVSRSLAEAEVALLGVLEEVDGAGDALFTQRCRAVSECSSSLKGGNLAGDIGWMSRPVEKPGEKLSKETLSKHAVARAALGLRIGELSDILVSEEGVHLLQRIA